MPEQERGLLTQWREFMPMPTDQRLPLPKRLLPHRPSHRGQELAVALGQVRALRRFQQIVRLLQRGQTRLNTPFLLLTRHTEKLLHPMLPE